MLCMFTGCSEKVSSQGVYYCRLHSYETSCAYDDWRRDERRDLRMFFARPKLLYDGDDDWRAKTMSKSVLPRMTRLFCSESSTWMRIGERAGEKRTYCSSVDIGDDGLLPGEYQLAHVELKRVIGEVFKLLTPMEEFVLRLRLAICGNIERDGDVLGAVDICEELTLNQVGEIIKRTREAVRRTELVAIFKLGRNRRASSILKEFYGERGRFFHKTDETLRDLTVTRIGEVFGGLSSSVRFHLIKNDDVMSRSRWLLSWKGNKMPRGVVLGDVVVEWTMEGRVGSDRGTVVGRYQSLVMYGGRWKNEHEMLVWLQ